MNTKTIDILELPLTERLTVGRQLASSQGKPVLFNGLTVTNNGKGKADVMTSGSPGMQIHNLTMARTKTKSKPEPTTQAGYFDGTGFVILNDSIGVL